MYSKAIDKILADNPHVVAGDPHMPPCTPTRKKPLTGANLPDYPYRDAEYQPPFDGYETQLVPAGVPVNWPTARSVPFDVVLEGVLGGVIVEDVEVR